MAMRKTVNMLFYYTISSSDIMRNSMIKHIENQMKTNHALTAANE